MTNEEFATITRDTIVVSLVTGRTYCVVSDTPYMDGFNQPAILVVPEQPYEVCDLDDNGCVTAFILNLLDGDIGGCVSTMDYEYETFAIKH